MVGLSIQRHATNDWFILRLIGYVDAHTFPVFEEAILEAIENEPAQLKIDCDGLNFINSSGLGLMLSAHRQLARRGGRLVIENLSREMNNLFDLLGFSSPNNAVETIRK